jgi:hypothetical protein
MSSFLFIFLFTEIKRCPGIQEKEEIYGDQGDFNTSHPNRNLCLWYATLSLYALSDGWNPKLNRWVNPYLFC